MTNDTRDMRCAVCRHEFNSQELPDHNLYSCPNCKTAFKALAKKDDGYVKVNWRELILLATYASRWSQTFMASDMVTKDALTILKNIIDDLSAFRPDGAPPLVNYLKVIVLKEITMTPVDKDPWSGEIEMKTDDKGNIISPFYQPPKNK